MYYEENGLCVDECVGLGVTSVVNSSYGCEKCGGGGCPDVPYFRGEYVNRGNYQLIWVIFSMSVDGYNLFT